MDQHDAVEGGVICISVCLSDIPSAGQRPGCSRSPGRTLGASDGRVFEEVIPCVAKNCEIPWLQTVPEVVYSIILDTPKMYFLKSYNHSIPRIRGGERERLALPPLPAGTRSPTLLAMALPTLIMTRELRL